MKIKILALITISLSVLSYWFFTTLPDGKLHVVFCDVGQGDAAYIRAPNGSDIVIDGGPDERVLSCLGKKMPFYDRTIELLILSHPQAAHLTGLIEILKRYQVSQIIDSSAKVDSQAYKFWEKLIKEKKIKRLEAKAGQGIKVDGQLKLDILWPISNIGDPNSLSTVVRLSYGSFSALFTGDLENPSLSREALAKWESFLLKVPHHGSKNGLTQKFLEAISPKIAVISVGKNSYGHPSAEALKLLNFVKLFRTDKDKTVEFITDGKTYFKTL